MLKGCSSEVYDPTVKYPDVVNVVLAIGIMLAFDVLFAMDRPSTLCVNSLLEATEYLRAHLRALLSDETEYAPFSMADHTEAFSRAVAQGKEAGKEPRFWRSAWKAPIWKSALETHDTLAQACNKLIINVTVSGDFGGEKSMIFKEVTKRREFKAVRQHVLGQFDQVFKVLTEVLKHELPGAMDEKALEPLQRCSAVDPVLLSALAKACEEI